MPKYYIMHADRVEHRRRRTENFKLATLGVIIGLAFVAWLTYCFLSNLPA